MSAPGVFRASFEAQRQSCLRLGSPFMGRLMALLGTRLTDDSAVGHRLWHWPGDPMPTADNVSMRLAGGLHALVIAGLDPGLAAVYPPHTSTDAALWAELDRAIRAHEAHLLDWLARPPQTNEVRRAAALIPAWHLVARRTGRPLALWEIGASAGLNLRADRFRLEIGAGFGPADSALRLAPDWTGPVPAPAPLEIVERRGIDLAPLNPRDPEQQLRLRAYLWADQPDRRRLTDAAFAIAAEHPACLTQGDAVAWLEAELPRRPANAATVLYHTVAWQYLPPESQARGNALISQAGAEATARAPLVRIGLEADGGLDGALSVTIWPGGTRQTLAEVDLHGRWLRWTGPI